MTNDVQNGHMIMVIGEHVNKYLSLNKLGIIKSRTETMPELGFKRNAVQIMTVRAGTLGSIAKL